MDDTCITNTWEAEAERSEIQDQGQPGDKKSWLKIKT